MPFGMKKGPDQVQTTTPILTPEQQALMGQERGIASGMAGQQAPGQTAGMGQAQNFWGNQVGAGNLALQGLTGDRAAFNKFSGPSMQGLNEMFARMRGQASNQAQMGATNPYGINTRALAMGGAERMHGIDEAQSQATYQNQADALGRMMSLYNSGGVGAQNLFSAGQYERMLPMLWAQGQMGLLNQSMGPTGTEQRTPTNIDWLGKVLGLGMTGAGMALGGPAGAQAGMSLADIGNASK